MTAFADSLDLRTAVVEAVADPDIVDVWPRIVSLAEARLNRELRTRRQLVYDNLTSVNGNAVLPADYLEAFQTFYQGREVLDPPFNGSFYLAYYGRLPTLADSLTASNWLLEAYPDVYLYSAAAEAAKYKRDPESASAFETMRAEAIASLRADDFSARYSRARISLPGYTP